MKSRYPDTYEAHLDPFRRNPPTNLTPAYDPDWETDPERPAPLPPPDDEPEFDLDPLRILTVRQPFASLIIAGIKRFESRTWSTEYRGIIGIHAAAQPDPIINHADWMAAHCPPDLDLTLGSILGTVFIRVIVPGNHVRELFPSELPLGRYDLPRVFAWQLTHPALWREPIPAKGKLGFWRYDSASYIPR